MSTQVSDDLKIAKTIKLFIGGDFPRTESGRSYPVYFSKSKKVFAQLCQASRKDLRNAVTVAQGAQHEWAKRSAYNRCQILYRMAEMAEGKREEFIDILTKTVGTTKAAADKAVNDCVAAFVYYAGFADKYQQVLGSVNPVAGPHHNFTTAEPVGLVGHVASQKFNLGQLAADLAAIIVSGNSVVSILAADGAAVIAPLSEVFATSDLPKGVVNLLTGDLEELYKHLGTHMEVQSLSFQNTNAKMLGEMKVMAAENMKRVVGPVDDSLSLEHLISFVEFKTVWHPIGN